MTPSIRIAAGCIGLALAAGASADTAYSGAADCRVALPQPQTEQRATWSGACKDGYADGPGAIQWFRQDQPGTRYEGMVARGQPQGDGIIQFPNKLRYQGDFKDGKRDGAGMLIYADDSTLKAAFRQNRIAGPVLRRYRNGSTYEGGWGEKGPEGAGKLSFALGGSFDGHWHLGKPEGDGEIGYPGGATLKGVFHQSFQLGEHAVEAVSIEETQRYGLKQEAPNTGSLIRRDAVSNFNVPPNKSYAELTPAQQALVKRDYPLLQPDDEPPYMAKGPETFARALQEAASKLQERGDMTLRAQIDANGKVSKVDVLVTPDERMADFAGRALMLTPFKPAVCAGQPCPMGVTVSYHFDLKPLN